MSDSKLSRSHFWKKANPARNSPQEYGPKSDFIVTRMLLGSFGISTLLGLGIPLMISASCERLLSLGAVLSVVRSHLQCTRSTTPSSVVCATPLI